MAKKPRIPAEQLSEETSALLDVLNEESDLAVILISSSFVDACLKSILQNKLLDGDTTERLLDHRGPLGSMRIRADLCYVMGLINKGWYNDLITLGEIRNLVAHHHLNQSFATPEIAALCLKLSMPLPGLDIGENDVRSKFKISVVMLANSLIIRALQIKGQAKTVSPKEPTHARTSLSPKKSK